MRAAVVLFPLVPVTATTRASAKSSSHRAMAVVTMTPAARGRRQLGTVPAHAGGPHHHVDRRPGDLGRGRAPGTPPPGAPRAGPAAASGSVVDEHRLDPRVRRRSRAMPVPRPPGPRRPPAGRTARRGSRHLGHEPSHGRGHVGVATRRARRPPSAGPSRPSSSTRARARSARAATTGGLAPPGCGRTGCRMAAADSRRSPTHSNGLSSSLIRAANPAIWSGSANMSRPMMAVSVGRSMNGASIRATNRHFGQWPHQPVPGRRRLAEGRVAAAERGVVVGEPGEGAGDGQLRVGPQRRAVAETRDRRTRRSRSPEQELELEALRVLVVDRDPVHHHRLLAGRPLDGHGDGVVAVEEAADHGDERDDGGDGHVAVEGARTR